MQPALYVLVRQFRHDGRFPGLYVLAGQPGQTDAPPEENVPTGHARQTEALVSPREGP